MYFNTNLYIWAVLYRWQQSLPQNMAMVKNILVFINFLYTLMVLNCSAVGFMVSLYFLTPDVKWNKRSSRCQKRPDRIKRNNAFLSCLSQVLSFHETLTAYKSVYFIATIVPISLILLGKIIKPARPARTKPRKEEWDAIAILDSKVLGLNFTDQ